VKEALQKAMVPHDFECALPAGRRKANSMVPLIKHERGSRDGQLLQHAADGRRANSKPLGQGVARHRIVFGAAQFQDGFQIVVCGLAVVETGSSRPGNFVLYAKSSLTVPKRRARFRHA
jgi:hypothetical protein